MTRRRLTAALLLLLGAGAAAGCGTGSGRATPEPAGSGPVVAHASAGDGSGDDALVAGSLTLSDGCLLLGGLPVVWPHGTTWDAESNAVRLPDGAVAGLGDRVSGGGGYLRLSDLPAELAGRLAGCPGNELGEVALFNARERVRVTR